jgi:Putative zinc-finger
MRIEYAHPRDEELLMVADGELSGYRAMRVRVHLAACRDCRARMAEIEDTIANFARVQRKLFRPELPPIAPARAQLRARLAEEAQKTEAGSWSWFLRFPTATRVAAYACLLVLTTVVIRRFVVQHPAMDTPHSTVLSSEAQVVPNHDLTPGSVRPVAVADVCVMPHEEVVTDVPASLRQKVLQEYGIANGDAENYEVDYLITPGLGGAEDLRNLWPEPNAAPAWNSRVKDALEERLHQLVCSGKVDLPTAQREIATDWIAAYRKYFVTDKPLSQGSDRMRLFGAFLASYRAPDE